MSMTNQYQSDIIATSAGDLKITFLGHGSLMFEFNDTVFYVDPYGKVADYAKLPPADVILITHEHQDHLDPDALASIRVQGTQVVMNNGSQSQVPGGGIVLCNGDSTTVAGVKIEAVPAYNVIHRRPTQVPYHPKGDGNGYVLTFGDKRVYVGGDTEDVPEMKDLGKIDVAFLPVNLPFTMTPEMAANAARTIRPRFFYPYHFGDTDLTKLEALLQDAPDIEVRVRSMA